MILGIDASQANRAVRSGTEWYAFHLISEFKKMLAPRADIRVRLYFRDGPRADVISDLPENFEIKILRWPVKYFWGQIRLSWEMLVHAPDILFCPAHTIPIIHPKKTFTTLHDIGFVDNPELYDRLSLWYHRFSAWLAVKTAYHIFTVSEFSRQRIIDHYRCRPEKLSVVHSGIATFFSAEKNVAMGKMEKRNTQKPQNILFIGRLEPKKNILGMVKAFEKFLENRPRPASSLAEKEINLVFAGRKVRIKNVEKYLVARPALKNRIKFPGYLDEGEKTRLLREAALFLFPTFYEGFGLPILEAQATNVPVITSNITSNPEIAGSGAVLVNPENIEEMAAAIGELLQNGELRKRKIELGRENVKKFSWQKTAGETLKELLS